MPCSDGGSRFCDGSCNLHYKRRADLLARLLCGLCRAQQANGTGNLILRVPGLADWWKEHQEEDRRREAREKEAARQQREHDLQTLEKLAKRLGKKVV